MLKKKRIVGTFVSFLCLFIMLLYYIYVLICVNKQIKMNKHLNYTSLQVFNHLQYIPIVDYNYSKYLQLKEKS